MDYSKVEHFMINHNTHLQYMCIEKIVLMLDEAGFNDDQKRVFWKKFEFAYNSPVEVSDVRQRASHWKPL